MSEEIWKEIPGFEGEYEASTFGRIRSMDRLVSMSDGRKQPRKGKIISSHNAGKGYLTLRLNGKGYSVHRLVYLTFVGEIPDGMQINHIDEDKHNNTPSNLNLMSCKENRNWGTAIKRGVEHFQKMLRKPILVYDYVTGTILYTFESITKASESLGIGTGVISEIVNHTPLKQKRNGKVYTYYRHQRNGYGFKFL